MCLGLRILAIVFVQVALAYSAWAQEPGGMGEPIGLRNVDKVGLLSETKRSARRIEPGTDPNELLLFLSNGITVVDMALPG